MLSIVLMGNFIESVYRYLLKPHDKNFDLASVQFGTLPGLSICTQFIGSLRCTISVSNGSVCRSKLVLLYLCSILLTQSYAPEPNPGSEVIKLFSCSTQLSTKFILLINVKVPTIIDILTFISMINTTSEILKARNFFICWYLSFYEQLKVRAQLSWVWKKFYNLGAWS